MLLWDFPCGKVDKNLPAYAGDVGSVPETEWFCMLRSNQAPVTKLLSLRSRARALQPEKPLQWEARELQWRVASARHN